MSKLIFAAATAAATLAGARADARAEVLATASHVPGLQIRLRHTHGLLSSRSRSETTPRRVERT